ncbi:MAG: hypothetical protein J0L92_34980 [Deltaproteobacteria bacterium]|nr:hypothetical protein [Deltaproteobacteria bacterium]
MSLPRGTPCDFTEACGMICPGMRVECREGVTVFFIGRCDTGPAPLDAFVVTSEAGSLDAGVIDDAASDVGMCAVREPTGATPCRNDGDCSSSTAERCIAPDEPATCGICMDPPSDCVLDSDCPDLGGVQYVCEEAEVSCPCSGDGVGTYCLPPCATTGCEDGFTCQASGHCLADPCGDDGYTCPLGTTCSPSGSGDPHGCVRTACSSDVDCPCGTACVEGHCHDSLGACETPRP